VLSSPTPEKANKQRGFYDDDMYGKDAVNGANSFCGSNPVKKRFKETQKNLG